MRYYKVKYLKDAGVLRIDTSERNIDIVINTPERSLLIKIKGGEVILNRGGNVDIKGISAGGDITIGDRVIIKKSRRYKP